MRFTEVNLIIRNAKLVQLIECYFGNILQHSSNITCSASREQ